MADVDNWLDHSPPHGHTHTYRVRAVTPAGPTGWSNEVSIEL